MKRLVVAAILLMSAVVGAQADSEYANTRKQWRGDNALQADAQYCDQRFGVVLDGAVTPAAYKKCMIRGATTLRTDKQGSQSGRFVIQRAPPSSPPNPAARVWGSRSTDRSWKPTVAGCGPRQTYPTVPRFSSPCR
jgi:hypothetical protein